MSRSTKEIAWGRAQNTSMVIVFTDETVFQYLMWKKKDVTKFGKLMVEGIPGVTVINLIKSINIVVNKLLKKN